MRIKTTTTTGRVVAGAVMTRTTTMTTTVPAAGGRGTTRTHSKMMTAGGHRGGPMTTPSKIANEGGAPIVTMTTIGDGMTTNQGPASADSRSCALRNPDISRSRVCGVEQRALVW